MTSKLKPTIVITSAGGALFVAYALHSGNAKFYSNVAMPAIQKMTSAETAHNFAIRAVKYGIYPQCKYNTPNSLNIRVFGKDFVNPIGLAAGFDKHCESISGLLNFGFGFVEVGAVTPKPQLGNSKPRVFRLTEDQAVINRYGFNSIGHEFALKNFMKWCDFREKSSQVGVVGVNLGKNKETEDAAEDYVKGVQVFGPVADFLVVNISSPNTPGLRNLQSEDQLSSLIAKVVEARNKLDCDAKPPILVKISPDLSPKDCKDIAAVVTRSDSGIAGLVISNTTVTRPDTLVSPNKEETGGLSGAPLKDIATKTIREMYRLTGGRLVIIGVGGVSSGQDALDKIKAGASLVQIYTSLTYHGPPVVNKIKAELADLLAKEGFSKVSDAVGADLRKPEVKANTATQ